MVFREWNNAVMPFDEVANDARWFGMLWSAIYASAADVEGRLLTRTQAVELAVRWVNNRRVAAFLTEDPLSLSNVHRM